MAVGPVLFDAAYVYEFGQYFQTLDVAAKASVPVGAETVPAMTTVRNALTVNRFYASIIYRFPGRF